MTSDISGSFASSSFASQLQGRVIYEVCGGGGRGGGVMWDGVCVSGPLLSERQAGWTRVELTGVDVGFPCLSFNNFPTFFDSLSKSSLLLRL